jgi:hypothetical protein
MRLEMKRKAEDMLHVSTPLIALFMRLEMKRKAEDMLHVSTPLIALYKAWNDAKGRRYASRQHATDRAVYET